MITETDDSQERNDDRTTLVWSLLVSGFANLMLWMFVAWGVALRMQAIQTAQAHPEETFMVASSSVRIAPHSHPVPQQPNPQPVVAQKSQQERPKRAQREAATPQPKAQPTEIARIVASAPPQPKPAPKSRTRGRSPSSSRSNRPRFSVRPSSSTRKMRRFRSRRSTLRSVKRQTNSTR